MHVGEVEISEPPTNPKQIPKQTPKQTPKQNPKPTSSWTTPNWLCCVGLGVVRLPWLLPPADEEKLLSCEAGWQPDWSIDWFINLIDIPLLIAAPLWLNVDGGGREHEPVDRASPKAESVSSYNLKLKKLQKSAYKPEDFSFRQNCAEFE